MKQPSRQDGQLVVVQPQLLEVRNTLKQGRWQRNDIVT